MNAKEYFVEIQKYFTVLNAFHLSRFLKTYAMLTVLFAAAGFAFRTIIQGGLGQFTAELTAFSPHFFTLCIFVAYSFSKTFSEYSDSNVSWLSFNLPVSLPVKYFGLFFYFLLLNLSLSLISLLIGYYSLYFSVENFSSLAGDPISYLGRFFISEEHGNILGEVDSVKSAENSVYLALISGLFVSRLFFRKLNLLKTVLIFLVGVYLLNEAFMFFEPTEPGGILWVALRENVYFAIAATILPAGYLRFKKLQAVN